MTLYYIRNNAFDIVAVDYGTAAYYTHIVPSDPQETLTAVAKVQDFSWWEDDLPIDEILQGTEILATLEVRHDLD